MLGLASEQAGVLFFDIDPQAFLSPLAYLPPTSRVGEDRPQGWHGSAKVETGAVGFLKKKRSTAISRYVEISKYRNVGMSSGPIQNTK